MHTPHVDIGRIMADHLHQTQGAIEELRRLKQQVNELQQQMSELRETGGDQGWMILKRAAEKIGMAPNSLAQRFRRGVYPEGVVWYKDGKGYMVHLRALREHMKTGNH